MRLWKWICYGGGAFGVGAVGTIVLELSRMPKTHPAAVIIVLIWLCVAGLNLLPAAGLVLPRALAHLPRSRRGRIVLTWLVPTLLIVAFDLVLHAAFAG